MSRSLWWLAGAVVVGLLVRLPGVAWGVNWPDGFTIHHPDEYTHIANADAIITPLGPRTGVPYPKAMAAYAAVPFLAWYAAHGSFGGPRVHIPWIVGTGRLISVVFGIAAILIVFAIARDALGDERAGTIAAWLLALGGLHVTQSHFFLADVPALTWTLLATWLLWRDLTQPGNGGHEALRWAAFAAGAAVALKLFVFVLPALAYTVLARPPRLRRTVHAAVFLLAGVGISSLGFDTPTAFYRAATLGTHVPLEFDRVLSAVLLAVQLPSLFSLPLLLLGAAGTYGLVRRLWKAPADRRRHALVIFGSVPLVALLFALVMLDPFVRHLLVLIPWAALAGGWALARWTAALERRGRSPALVLAPVFAWMALFVIDGERFFLFEPRNDALRWVRTHVAPGTSLNWMGRRTPEGYRSVRWLVEGQPDVLVFEMYEANQSLSGVNWKNAYPSDPRRVYDGRTAERVAAIQALFQGTSDYAMIARFPERYLMPEYRVAMALLGDRSRSYITEVVVFARRGTALAPTPAR